MKRADFRLLHQIRRVRDFAHIEFFKQAAIGIQIAHMRRGKGHVRLRRAARQFGFVQTVDGAARNKLHFHAGFFGELFGDSFVNQIPEAAAPGADNQLVSGHCITCAQHARGQQR